MCCIWSLSGLGRLENKKKYDYNLVHVGKISFYSAFFVFISKLYFIRTQASQKLYAHLKEKMTKKWEKGDKKGRNLPVKPGKIYTHVWREKWQKSGNLLVHPYLLNNEKLVLTFVGKNVEKMRRKVEISKSMKHWEKKQKESGNLYVRLWKNGKKWKKGLIYTNTCKTRGKNGKKVEIYTHTCEAMEKLYAGLGEKKGKKKWKKGKKTWKFMSTPPKNGKKKPFHY